MTVRSIALMAGALLLANITSTISSACTTNVTTMGVVGDGVTDNTAALNNIFSAIAAVQFSLAPQGPTAIPCRTVYFPQGTYDVSGTITVNASDITIYGDNRLTSIIQQKSANKIIFQWTHETSIGTFGIFMHDLGLNFTNTPNTSSTGQIGMYFACASGSGFGYAVSTFENLAISNSYIGIGTSPGNTVCPIWSSTFRNLLFTYTQHTAISLISTGGGMPSLLLDRIDILNYNTGMQSDGPAIAIYDSSGLVARSIDIENWFNFGYDLEGGKGTLIDQPRFEHLSLNSATGGYPVLFFLGNNDFTIRNLVIESFAETQQSGVASIFAVGNGTPSGVATLDLQSAYIGPATLLTGAHVFLFKAPSPQYAHIKDGGLILQSGIVEYQPSNMGNDEFSRVTTDGMPPMVDAFPAPSAMFRNRSFTVLGSGTGVADKSCVCLMNADGSYTWHCNN